MSWWGKVLGGTFGFLMGGPLGALIGAALGHNFDKGFRGFNEQPLPGFSPGAQERVQTAFFTATFSVMGHLAKADGRVSEHEIQLARALMAQMNLNADLKKAAIGLFNEGKADDFPLDEVLEQFRRECHRRRNLLQMFLEILLQSAYADGTLHAEEKRVLLHICDRLGFSKAEFAHLEALVRGVHAGQGQAGAPARGQQLAEAYQILGVGRDASEAEVKKAYRRLMNQHHPDKLVAKGLPEEMIKLATVKTQEIRKAYDLVRDSRQ